MCWSIVIINLTGCKLRDKPMYLNQPGGAMVPCAWVSWLPQYCRVPQNSQIKACCPQLYHTSSLGLVDPWLAFHHSYSQLMPFHWPHPRREMHTAYSRTKMPTLRSSLVLFICSVLLPCISADVGGRGGGIGCCNMPGSETKYFAH